jgi:hypothetical protein
MLAAASQEMLGITQVIHLAGYRADSSTYRARQMRANARAATAARLARMPLGEAGARPAVDDLGNPSFSSPEIAFS